MIPTTAKIRTSLPRLLLQPWGLGLYPDDRAPDPADLAARSGRGRDGESRAADHQRSRKDKRQIIAAGRGGRRWELARRPLAHRHRFAGQQRLIDLYVAAFNQQAVGGHTIAFRQHQRIAAHDFATRDAAPHAVAHDQRARARQIAQGFENTLAAALLHDCDRHRQRGEGEQYERIGQLADHDVEQAAPSRSPNMGSRITSATMRSGERRSGAGRSLGPSRASRRAASRPLRPTRAVEPP